MLVHYSVCGAGCMHRDGTILSLMPFLFLVLSLIYDNKREFIIILSQQEVIEPFAKQWVENTTNGIVESLRE